MDDSARFRRRPRPVADAPVEAVAARAEAVAKAWLLALLEAAPLERAADVPAAQIARRGPRLCAAAARAVASDEAYARLMPDGDLYDVAAGAAAAAGARGPVETVAAIEELRRALWSAFLAELRDAPGALVADLGDRLAAVCAAVAAAAVERADAAPSAPARPDEETRPVGPAAEPYRGHPRQGAGLEPERFGAGKPPDPAERFASVEAPELGDAERSGPADAPDVGGAESFGSVGARDPGDAERFGPVDAPGTGPDEPLPHAADPFAARAAGAPAEPAARPAPLWLAALERQLAEGAARRRCFGLLLVELAGAEHLEAAEPLATGRRFEGVARAVRNAVRRADIIAHEGPGRLWVISPDAGRLAAEALAHRIARAVSEGLPPAHGVPLQATVGVAVFPDDGLDAATLTGEAEEALYRARAAGVTVAGPAGEADEHPNAG